MNANDRPIDRWFARYGEDHRHPTNHLIHIVCVPLIVWSVIALLWCIPSPTPLFESGIWAGIAMFTAAMFYLRQSRRLAIGVGAAFLVFGVVTRLLHDALGPRDLALLALAVFAIAWVGQFVGHRIEGRRPSFLTDLTYLLIGPGWLMAGLYRRLGLAY